MSSLRIPSILGSHMVLQQGRPARFWGWSAPMATITASLAGQTATAKADAAGRWRVELPTPSAGGPYEATLSDGQSTINLTDILVGEVWVCSGQSNMEWPFEAAHNAETELPKANHPLIRLFNANPGRKPCAEPQEDLAGKWQLCATATAAHITAVGYFFGREIMQTQGIPVGIISSSWGGTLAEAWTEWSFLKKNPECASITKPYEALLNRAPDDFDIEKRLITHAQKVMFYQDPGNRGFLHGYAEPDFDDSAWPAMLPSYWQLKGHNVNGAFWFRKEVTIPAEWVGKELRIELGALDDFDVTYFNGIEVGSTDRTTQNWWMHRRVYTIPANLVKAGRNIVATRIFDEFGNGGFAGGSQMRMYCGEQHIPILGEWRYKIEYAFEKDMPAKVQALMISGGANHHNSPSNLYNGMIHPITPLPIRGVLWYQGESNASRAHQYRTLFKTLINSWRAAWGQPDMPFLFVQLANYQLPQTDPCEEGWGPIRDAQAAALSLPNTGMVTAIDIGEANDIHPRDKESVGHRLALVARATVYGESIPYSSAAYRSMEINGDTITLNFDHTYGGLTTKDGEAPKSFVIRGADTEWQWAEARIDGERIHVRSPLVARPIAVRHAWANNPPHNVYNAIGLPLFPFTTES